MNAINKVTTPASTTVTAAAKKAASETQDVKPNKAEELGVVIEKIQKTLDELALTEQAPKENEDQQDDEAKQKRKDFVALRIRFYPLLELMKKAHKKGKHVYWVTL